MKIKVGLLGYGFMGHNHAVRIKKMETDGEIELVAVCDNDERQLAETPESVKVYHDMDALFQDSDINTVLVAVPNHIHKEAVIKAAKAGLHILCEKPVAMTVAEFDEMMRAVDENGVKFTVHQQRRWDKDFRTAKYVYDNHLTGEPYTIQSKLYGINGNMHDWHIYPQYGGGMLFDWGVHLIDQMLWMVNSPVQSVFADVRNVVNKEVDDYFKVMISFANGITGEIELGTYFLADKENWFERHWFIGGNQGSYYSDGFDPKGKLCKTSKLLTNVPGQITMTAAGPTRSFGPPEPGVLITDEVPIQNTDHSMYFDNFVNAMKDQEEFIVTREQVRRVLSLMEAIRQSAKLHESVTFEQS